MSTCNRLDLQNTRISIGDAKKSPRSLMWSELGFTRILWNLGCGRNFWSRKGYLCDPYNMGCLQALSAHGRLCKEFPI